MISKALTVFHRHRTRGELAPRPGALEPGKEVQWKGSCGVEILPIFEWGAEPERAGTLPHIVYRQHAALS